MSRDTSNRSSEDRIDPSLSAGFVLWAAEFFSKFLLILIGLVVGVVFCWTHSLTVGLPLILTSLLSLCGLFGLVRERVEQ